jgi:ATP-dependent helicase HepA
VITYDRKTALFRDDVEFLTIDHPMVTGALDLYLSSDHGTSSFALWRDPTKKELALECAYILECISPVALNSDRFLPPAPIRVVVNQQLKDVTDQYPFVKMIPILKNGDIKPLLSNQEITSVLIPSMIDKSLEIVESETVSVIKASIVAMKKVYTDELNRLEFLRSQGAKISGEDITLVKHERDNLEGYLKNARLRLSSVRLIRRGP